MKIIKKSGIKSRIIMPGNWLNSRPKIKSCPSSQLPDKQISILPIQKGNYNKKTHKSKFSMMNSTISKKTQSTTNSKSCKKVSVSRTMGTETNSFQVCPTRPKIKTINFKNIQIIQNNWSQVLTKKNNKSRQKIRSLN